MEYEIGKTQGKLTVTDKYTCITKSGKRAWRDYYNHSTWHGVRQIFSADSWVRKVCWILLVSAALGFLVYFLYLDICLFMDQPGHEVTSHELTGQARYPHIRICPSVPYKLTLANSASTFLNWARAKLNQTINWNATISDALDLRRSHSSTFKFTFKNDFSFTGGVSEYLFSCMLNGVACGAGKADWFMSDDGLCIVVNSSGTTVKSGWNGDNGILLILKVDGSDVFPVQVDTSAGVKVSFFEEDDYVNGREQHLIEVGQVTQLTLRRTQRSYKASRFPNSDCKDSRLLYDRRYSVENCLTECRIKAFEKVCGCGWPFIKGTTVGQCSSVEYAYCVDVLNATRNINCNCPSPCNEDRYDVQSSHSSFVVPLVKDMIRDPLITNDVDYSKKYAIVKIALHPRIAVTQVQDSFPFSSLLGHVGGLLALFIGWSVLSFFEIIDVMLRVCDSSCLVTKKESADDFFTNNHTENLQMNENGTAHTVNEPSAKDKTASWKHRNGVMEY